MRYPTLSIAEGMGEGAMGKGGDSATMKSRSRGHPTSLSIDPGFVHPHMSKHEIAFPDLLSELATVREKRGFGTYVLLFVLSILYQTYF